MPIPEWIGFAGAALLTAVLIRVLSPVAPRLDLIDYPQGRKRHEEPIPLIGGLAMLLAWGLSSQLAFGLQASGDPTAVTYSSPLPLGVLAGIGAPCDYGVCR